MREGPWGSHHDEARLLKCATSSGDTVVKAGSGLEVDSVDVVVCGVRAWEYAEKRRVGLIAAAAAAAGLVANLRRGALKLAPAPARRAPRSWAVFGRKAILYRG